MTIPHNYLSGGGVTSISVAVTVAAGERLRVYVACGNNGVSGGEPDLPSSVLWGATEPQLLTAESGGAVAAGTNGKLHSYALDAPAAGTYNVTATWDGGVDEAAIVARVFPAEGDITRITNSGSASPASVAAAIAEGNLLAGVLYIATDNGDLDNITEILDEYDEEEEASKVDAFVDPGDTEGYMAVVGMSFEGVASETKALAATFSGTSTGDASGWAAIAHKIAPALEAGLVDPTTHDLHADIVTPRVTVNSITSGKLRAVLMFKTTGRNRPSWEQIFADPKPVDESDSPVLAWREITLSSDGVKDFDPVPGLIGTVEYTLAYAAEIGEHVVYHDFTAGDDITLDHNYFFTTLTLSANPGGWTGLAQNVGSFSSASFGRHGVFENNNNGLTSGTDPGSEDGFDLPLAWVSGYNDRVYNVGGSAGLEWRAVRSPIPLPGVVSILWRASRLSGNRIISHQVQLYDGETLITEFNTGAISLTPGTFVHDLTEQERDAIDWESPNLVLRCIPSTTGGTTASAHRVHSACLRVPIGEYVVIRTCQDGGKVHDAHSGNIMSYTWCYPSWWIPSLGVDLHATAVEFGDEPTAEQIIAGHASDDQPYEWTSFGQVRSYAHHIEELVEDDERKATHGTVDWPAGSGNLIGFTNPFEFDVAAQGAPLRDDWVIRIASCIKYGDHKAALYTDFATVIRGS